MRPPFVPPTSVGEVTVYGYRQSDRSPHVGVSWPGAKLTVDGDSTDAEGLARWIAEAPALVGELSQRLHAAEMALAEARAQIPPATRTRIMGEGCIRERDGWLWLLSNAEKGWSAFGFRFDGWDALFRAWDLEVGPPQQDALGQWWPARPRRSR